MGKELSSKEPSMQQIWDRYCSISYKYGNRLDQQQYDDCVKGYGAYYDHLMPQDKAARILDIACGAGQFLYYLENRGYTNYVGIDISAEQVDFARQWVTGGVEVADVFEFLKDKVNEYDLVVSNDFIEHMSKDHILQFLSLIYQALKPGGRVLLKTANMAAFSAIAMRYNDFTHEIGFTEKSLAVVLRVSKFQEVEVFPEPHGRKTAILLLGMRLLYRAYTDRVPKCLTRLIVGTGVK